MNYEKFKINSQEDANEFIGKTGLYGVSKKQMWWKHNAYLSGELTTLDKIISIDFFNNTFEYQPNSTNEIFSRKFDKLYFMEINEEPKENVMNTNEEIKENVMNNLKIFRTNDYSIFKFSELNRDINDSNLQRIKHSIKQIGFHSNKRILVNESMEIIDGQHRFLACKELGLPIEYEIVEEDDNDKNIYTNLNIGGKPLSALDYIKYYSKKGYPVYVMISKLCEKYKNKCSITTIICAISGACGTKTRRFDRTGYVSAVSEGTLPQRFDYYIADESLFYLEKIKSIPTFKKWYLLQGDVRLIISLCVLKQAGVDLQKLCSKIEENVSWLLKNPILNIENLHYALERLYYKKCTNTNQLNFRVLYSQYTNNNLRKPKSKN